MRATEFRAGPAGPPFPRAEGAAAQKKALEAFEASEHEHAQVFPTGPTALPSRPGPRRPATALSTRSAHETSAPRDPVERLAERIASHARAHGRDPERMLRLAWLMLGKRCVTLLRIELDQAERDYPRRVRAEREAARALAHAVRTFDASGIAMIRQSHAEAAARVPRAQRRVFRARVLLDQWLAEMAEAALGLGRMGEVEAADPIDAERARLGLPPSPR